MRHILFLGLLLLAVIVKVKAETTSALIKQNDGDRDGDDGEMTTLDPVVGETTEDPHAVVEPHEKPTEPKPVKPHVPHNPNKHGNPNGPHKIKEASPISDHGNHGNYGHYPTYYPHQPEYYPQPYYFYPNHGNLYYPDMSYLGSHGGGLSYDWFLPPYDGCSDRDPHKSKRPSTTSDEDEDIEDDENEDVYGKEDAFYYNAKQTQSENIAAPRGAYDQWGFHGQYGRLA